MSLPICERVLECDGVCAAMFACLNDDPNNCKSCITNAIGEIFDGSCAGDQISCTACEAEICAKVESENTSRCECSTCEAEIDSVLGCGLQETVTSELGTCGENFRCLVPNPTTPPSKAPTDSPTRTPSKPPTTLPTPQPSPSPNPDPVAPSPPTSTLAPTTCPDPSDPLCCFSGSNLVDVKGKGDIPIGDVKIGDYVRSHDGEFSRVYSLGHLDHDSTTNFIQIHVSGKDKPLEMTPRHMLIVNGAMKQASDVNRGDKVGDFEVVKVRSVTRQGRYAPVTESGLIQVGGMLASNHATVLDIDPAIHHAMIYAYSAPLRLACRIHFGICERETYTDGHSDWIYPTLRVALAVRNYHVAVQIMAVAVAGPWIFAATFPSLAFAMLCVFVLFRKAKKKKNKSPSIGK